jgi:hypothetical protein
VDGFIKETNEAPAGQVPFTGKVAWKYVGAQMRKSAQITMLPNTSPQSERIIIKLLISDLRG